MPIRSIGRFSFPLATATLQSSGLPVIALLLCLNLATSSAVASELDAPPLVTAAHPSRATVRIEKDVDYLGADRTEKADLYLPGNMAPGERRPGIVIIHGGGWSSGDKASARERNIGSTLANMAMFV